ncbi:disintegrin and metalloproteinase domain-containing protein 22 isoform X2 [Carassius gibelio]|uniref:disintegrin and metalloproteinase domain-containing protein 22 isoform X2 n=1 Tax=Carassius gibelio TaxID=101364 RepID=UPI002278250F|nr:disintegrin and metalloproteinase domain-containing protein 22 isoform X2 [Carassius gibelio]
MLATRCLLLWAAVTARLAVTGWGSSIKRDGAERGSEQNAYSEELTQPQRLLQRSDAEEELPHGHLGTLVKIDADGAHPIHLAQISFQVTAFGIPFVLDLELNHDLLSSNYVERHFDEDGRPFQSLGGEHCYYHGHVRGVQRSWAALSTCHGLQGMFSDGNFSYGIEPLHNSSDQDANTHVVYRMADIRLRPHSSGSTRNSSDSDINTDYPVSMETNEPELTDGLRRAKRQVKVFIVYIR